MTTNHKFDIFHVLTQISNKNHQFIDNLSDDDLKNIHPLVLMRWLSGVNSKYQVYAINEIANPLIFELGKHKRLLLKVLAACSSKTAGRCNWLKSQTAKSQKPVSERVIMAYFNYPRRKAKECVELVPYTDLISMAEDLGFQADDMQKLRREHKTAA